jgi:tetrahydromethanopterin S-methyltransferase subunit G
MNQENLNINEIMRNTRKYWYVDGLSEIAGGVLIVMIGVTYYLSSLIPNVVIRSLMLGLGQPVVIILGSVLIGKAVKKIKETLTYPRTGYLSFRRRKSRKISRILYGAVVGLLVGVVVGFFTSIIPDRIIPLVTSLFIAVLIIFIGYQNNVPRFYVIAVLTVGLGLVISLWYPEGVLPFVFMFVGSGFLWLISGGWTLFSYLRNTTPVEGLDE